MTVENNIPCGPKISIEIAVAIEEAVMFIIVLPINTVFITSFFFWLSVLMIWALLLPCSINLWISELLIEVILVSAAEKNADKISSISILNTEVTNKPIEDQTLK